jgi:hypothetical protein
VRRHVRDTAAEAAPAQGGFFRRNGGGVPNSLPYRARLLPGGIEIFRVTDCQLLNIAEASCRGRSKSCLGGEIAASLDQEVASEATQRPGGGADTNYPERPMIDETWLGT